MCSIESRPKRLWLRAAANLPIVIVFCVLALVIALIRLRTSPAYPHLNEVNSDIYVYQVVGNSWVQGLLPYRDVFDVKGPSFFLLFGLFALIRPWSMGPPLVVLMLLAFASLWLAYAIARLQIRRRRLAALCASVSCMVIYLSVATVATSFTVEELAVPGVLLLLWTVSRWLGGTGPVSARWWILDGVVFAALFWAKYQVVAPWAALLLALLVLAARKQLEARQVARVVVLNLCGSAIGTVVILVFYIAILPQVFQAYFMAKHVESDPSRELFREAGFVFAILRDNTPAALILVAVLGLLVVQTLRGGDRLTFALTLGFVLSCWASSAFVRHPNNLFVPLSFLGVAMPRLFMTTRFFARTFLGAVIAVVLAGAACIVPMTQSVTTYRLLRPAEKLTCHSVSRYVPSIGFPSSAAAFSTATSHGPILSLGNLFAARSMYISHLPMSRPFTFVDASWSHTISADHDQTRYLQDSTFTWIWIHVKRLDPSRNVENQIAHTTYTNGPDQSVQVAALVNNYEPVLTCANNVLLRARNTH